MLFRKLRQEVENLRWKVGALEDKNKDLRAQLEQAIQALRQHVVAVKNAKEVSDGAILSGRSYEVLEAKHLDAFLGRHRDALFVDVRTEMEFNQGYIPGASHIPIDQIAYRMQELESHRHQPVIVYCASGSRSEVACEQLSQKGFTQVFHFVEGVGGYTGKLEKRFENPRAEVPADRARTPQEENLFHQVRAILEKQINPVVASHGGVIELLDVIRNDIYVRMGGGCQGCSSATATLKRGVEETLRKEIPDVGRLFDTTDHASGLNPYYTAH